MLTYQVTELKLWNFNHFFLKKIFVEQRRGKGPSSPKHGFGTVSTSGTVRFLSFTAFVG